MKIVELAGTYDGMVPLRVIQDSLCSEADVKCRRSIAESSRRLRKRGLLVADGSGRGLRYGLTPQLLELLVQVSSRKGRTFKPVLSPGRPRSTRPVDAPYGTMLRTYKMILERRKQVPTREIQRALGISRTATRYHIRNLKRLELIREPSPGLIDLAPLDGRRISKALEDAGEYKDALIALGLEYAHGRIWLKPFKARDLAKLLKKSLRYAEHILRQLEDKSVVIGLPGRKCPKKVYIINPIYPTKIPQHTHDRGTVHLYGGQRVWRRRKRR
jgi:Mn-dependent DtxR family transcriptional regulator